MSDFDVLIVNVVTAARAGGFARGRGEDDAAANKMEDAAVDRLREALAPITDERIEEVEAYLERSPLVSPLAAMYLSELIAEVKRTREASNRRALENVTIALPPEIVAALNAYDAVRTHLTRDLSGVDTVRAARAELESAIARALR